MADRDIEHVDAQTAHMTPALPDPEGARRASAAIDSSLPLLGPDEEEALLAQAGFPDTRLFHAGLAFRGWIARA